MIFEKSNRLILSYIIIFKTTIVYKLCMEMLQFFSKFIHVTGTLQKSFFVFETNAKINHDTAKSYISSSLTVFSSISNG